jgi:hypothetical protein
MFLGMFKAPNNTLMLLFKQRLFTFPGVQNPKHTDFLFFLSFFPKSVTGVVND